MPALAQKQKKADKLIIHNLHDHIEYLASDKLEGRRTGTNGERLAYEYISKQFELNHLIPEGDKGTYIQAFEVNEGKQVNPATHLLINGNDLALNTEYFPFVQNPNRTLESLTSLQNNIAGNTWFMDIAPVLDENKTNPHFELKDFIKTSTHDMAGKGAVAVIYYNSSAKEDELKFEPKGKTEESAIPAFYISREAMKKYIPQPDAALDIQLRSDIGDKTRTGHNILGYINNGAACTVILGAHYDHLGYGEDHNSLYTGTVKQIHNGADDNASGTAALIELGRLLSQSKFKHCNYLLASFSGEELGLYGSKYYTDHPVFSLDSTSYMINMDMVGRLNDSTHGLTIGGYGTSPVWGEMIIEKDDYFRIKFDSSGTGPSDHTSFYRKNIPVLFFFTGVHSDYHKPTDDAEKINYTGEWMVVKYIYNLVGALNKKGKLAFTKTRESATSSKNSFKVSLGVMPDYTFSGGGVRIDGVSEGKLAQRIGLKAGDILLQLGEHSFSDVQAYMQVLGKFNKGDATKLKIKRGKDELTFDIVF